MQEDGGSRRSNMEGTQDALQRPDELTDGAAGRAGLPGRGCRSARLRAGLCGACLSTERLKRAPWVDKMGDRGQGRSVQAAGAGTGVAAAVREREVRVKSSPSADPPSTSMALTPSQGGQQEGSAAGLPSRTAARCVGWRECCRRRLVRQGGRPCAAGRPLQPQPLALPRTLDRLSGVRPGPGGGGQPVSQGGLGWALLASLHAVPVVACTPRQAGASLLLFFSRCLRVRGCAARAVNGTSSYMGCPDPPNNVSPLTCVAAPAAACLQRYRICPPHMMADALEMDGVLQRFCQQVRFVANALRWGSPPRAVHLPGLSPSRFHPPVPPPRLHAVRPLPRVGRV